MNAIPFAISTMIWIGGAVGGPHGIRAARARSERTLARAAARRADRLRPGAGGRGALSAGASR